MRFKIKLNQNYFSFAKGNLLCFNGWGDDGTNTFFMDYPDDSGTDVDVFHIAVLPAVKFFHEQCQVAQFTPATNECIGKVEASTGLSFSIIS